MSEGFNYYGFFESFLMFTFAFGKGLLFGLFLILCFIFSRFILGPMIILPIYKFGKYLYEVFFTNIHVEKEYLKKKREKYLDDFWIWYD